MAQEPETGRRRRRKQGKLDTFLDAHVDRALLPLEALFSANDLAQIRSVLDGQMRADPALKLLIDAALRERQF